MTVAYPATVTALADEGPLVRVPMLGAGQEWGPLATSVPDLVAGDRVIVMPLGEHSDALQVLARLQARQPRQTEIVGLDERLDDIEARDAAQDSRLAGIDALNGTQNGRLSAIETLNGQQTTRLDGIDTRNNQQDSAIAANGTAITANGTRITNLDGAALHRTGAETKAGVLTLSDEPVIPVATKATSPVRSDDARVHPAYMCKVKLTGPNTGDQATSGYVTSNSDVYAGNAGASGIGVWEALSDKYGMFVPGTPHKIIAPAAGIYRATYRTVYLNSTNTTDTLVAFVTRGSTGSANSVARDARRCINLGSDGSPLLATDEFELTAGQAVYWGNWSTINARIGLGLFPLAGTMMTLTYLGPA